MLQYLQQNALLTIRCYSI